MKIDLIILLTSTVFNLGLTQFILLRNPKHRINQIFSFFGSSIILWTIFNYASDNSASYNLLYTRLTLAMGACIGASIFLLSIVFPKKLKVSLLSRIVFTVLSGLAIVLSLTPFFVKSITKIPDGVNLIVGPLYSYFSFYLIFIVAWSIWNLIIQHKHGSAAEKNQVKLFTIGVFIYTSLAIFSNVILPIIVSNWSSSKFGPIFTVPFVGLTSYAIIKHGMFDIRLGITRIIGFLITVGITATIYTFLILSLGSLVVSFNDLSTSQLLVLITSVVLFGLTFHYLQTIIARLSQRIFYQDSYDLRTTLDELSDALIASNETDQIIRKSLDVISSAIKPSDYFIIVFDNNQNTYHTHSFNRKPVQNLNDFLDLIKTSKRPLISKDLIFSNNIFKKTMHQENVSLILRLGAKHSPTGLIFFGNKINGSIYTTQDMNLLNIAAKNFSLALENAKKYEQIMHFADTLQSEIEKATLKLRRANTRLKSLDVLKNDFISMASHQLRSPATSVYEALHMLNHPSLSPKDRADLIVLAEANSKRLVTVVKTMLNMARIQSGHFTIDKSNEDVAKLAETVILQSSIIASQKNINLEFKKPNKTMISNIDVAKINEAMANYIENAIKYSPNKSTINIELRYQDNKIIFEVKDTGMGVPIKERDHLFGKFYRASNARQEEPDGNGIGLYVVKSIANGHGGDTYYSPLNPGSLFGFWILP